MSGDSALAVGVHLGHGPRGTSGPGPFSAAQLTRLDEALTVASRQSGMLFSVYIGELAAPPRRTAELLFRKLNDEAVLIAVSPAQRVLQIVTGRFSGPRLPDRYCAQAALTMRSSFTNGDLIGGLVNGLNQLCEAAGPA